MNWTDLIEIARHKGITFQEHGVNESAIDPQKPETEAEQRQTEKQFQAEVIREAKKRGWKYYHTHNSRKSVAGFPDLVLLRGEHSMVAELKVGKNKATPAQMEWLKAFSDAGICAVVWTPNDWPEILKVLE